MSDQPGRAAWACPKCGFVVGFVNGDNNLMLWSYSHGPIALRCGTFVCGCGQTVQWIEARAPTGLDKDVASVVQ